MDYLLNKLWALMALLQRPWDLVEVMPCMAVGEFAGTWEGVCMFWRDVAENIWDTSGYFELVLK